MSVFSRTAVSRRAFSGSLLALCAASAGLGLMPQQSLAQAYPSQPIKIVVPYAAGGITDAATRIVAAKMRDGLGQPIVVENRAGASGIPGTDVVARAAPDGYTLLIISISHTSLRALYKDLPFDPEKDFAPVGLIASAPSVLVTAPSNSFKNVAEAIQYVKANPSTSSYASAGAGTLSHLQAEALKRQAKFDLIHVPMKGGGPASLETMSGRVTLFFDTLTTAAPQVQAGKLRGLAVTSARRSPMLPDVPTMVEAGYPGFVTTAWAGLVAPAKTPAAVLDRVNAEMVKALAAPDVQAALAKLGMDVEGGNRQRFGTFLGEETTRWSTLIKDAGITAQ